MGIQPIDLQTLYTQMDKVGKAQLSQQAAAQQAKDAADADVRKTAEAKAKTVQGPDSENEFAGKVSERNGGGQNGGDGKMKKNNGDAPGAENGGETPRAETEPLHDAGVGGKIDISV